LSQLPKKLNRRSPLYVAVMAGSLATAGVAVATLAGCEGGIKKAAEVPSAVAKAAILVLLVTHATLARLKHATLALPNGLATLAAHATHATRVLLTTKKLA